MIADPVKSARPTATITAEAAFLAADAAVRHGLDRGVNVVAAVVDPAGDLMALWRWDGAFAASVSIAADKAYTAAVFGCTTDELAAGLENPLLRNGIAGRPRVILFGGGAPLIVDGALIGAIGVSGGSEDDDRSCAAAGAGAILQVN